jgi:hypothetical protein
MWACVCSARRDVRVPSSSLAAPTEGSEEDEEGEETVFQMIDGKEIVEWGAEA